MGSFRLAAGTRHLHRDCNFTELLVETALKSLRHSCRSELRVFSRYPRAQTIPSPHLAPLGSWLASDAACRDSSRRRCQQSLANRHAADGGLAPPSGTHGRSLHSFSPCALARESAQSAAGFSPW